MSLTLPPTLYLWNKFPGDTTSVLFRNMASCAAGIDCKQDSNVSYDAYLHAMIES